MFALNFLIQKCILFEIRCLMRQALLKGRVIQSFSLIGFASFEIKSTLSFDDFHFKGIVPEGILTVIRISVVFCHDIVLNFVF